VKRLLLPIALALGAPVLLLGAVAGSGSSAANVNVATAQAFGIRILVPNQPDVTSGYVAAPNNSTGQIGGFAYPADGSAVTSGPITLSASAATSPLATGVASVDVSGITLFGGEVTIASVDAKVSATVDATEGSGDFTGTGVTGIGGSAVAGTQLADWGTIVTSPGAGESTADGAAHGWHGSVSAVDIRLTQDHDGLPAGTEIVIGYASANVDAVVAPPPPATTAPTTTTTPTTTEATTTTVTTPRSNAKKKLQQNTPRVPPVLTIPTLHPQLTAGRYVFPVYGPVSYGDTFGAARADVSGGWHHGDDIFAPLGAPVLAVSDGTVFSVGWNKIGGWRLWLRDLKGNQFYYAHLSAYSPFARNGARVRAGTVLGFVGDTGDAKGTPYHLHFEVHPVGLLPLGYDGAVDPTPYLDAWKRLQDINFSTAGAWLPGLAGLTGSRAPEPGAILLRISDISSASGLDPGSLRRALAPLSGLGAAALAGAVDQPASTEGPVLDRG